jgi:hypothetical protein
MPSRGGTRCSRSDYPLHKEEDQMQEPEDEPEVVDCMLAALFAAAMIVSVVYMPIWYG